MFSARLEDTIQRLLIAPAFCCLLAGCLHAAPPVQESALGTPPPMLVGAFEDDYGNRYRITPDLWFHRPGACYHVTRWVSEAGYLIARNDEANPGDGGRWTRIDWVELSGMPPYDWAFCLSAYAASTAAEAEATRIADTANPRTGCNGFPFSRMCRLDDVP